MTARIHYGLDERKQRWRDFLDMEQPPSHVFRINYAPDDLERPQLWPEKKKELIEWAWQTYERHLSRIEWLRDDSMPCLYVATGTEIFAEAFGCEVYRAEEEMPFALPMIHSAAEAGRVEVPELSSSSLAVLFEMADELHRRAGDGALVKLVDVQSPMDIASLIWDKNTFYMALIEEPGAVKELAAKVSELLVAFLDEWFGRYGAEFIAHYPDYYMPVGITLSEDEVGVVNEEMFEEFFLPELVELSDRYGGIGMHCCADAHHQWANFLKVPNLRLLNLVQSVEELRSAYEFFAPHVPQMHSWFGGGPAWTWPEQFPEGARVAMEGTANSRDEALELSDRLWTACGRD